MNIEQMVSQITPELYLQLQTAVEIGRWPDGSRVSDEQREMLIQALMIWQSRHDAERDEPYTISADGEMRFACDSERERLQAAFGDTFKITLN